jgi:glycosyltransferase involved in cell wall biosynthesis
MKIGLVIYGSLETVSGGYYYDRRLVESLRQLGDEVHILSLPWRNYPAHLTDNLRFRLPSDLDVLVQDELNHPSLLAANARPHPYPVVSLVHHLRCSEQHPRPQSIFYRIVERRYLRSVDGFIFNSQTTQAAVENLAGEKKPSVLAYPPTDRFGGPVSEAEVTRRAAHPGPLHLAFLGNVIPRKGLHTLLDALSRLPAGAATLNVVGSLAADPVYACRIRERAAGLGPVDSVSFRGILEEAELRELLLGSDLLVVPSSYEGYGIVYLEGMAFGLPAIGTTAGAAGEIITSGGNGYLIEPGDSTGLASSLAALHSDRELLSRLSRSALERYRQAPAWDRTVQSVRDFLLKMASKNG